MHLHKFVKCGELILGVANFPSALAAHHPLVAHFRALSPNIYFIVPCMEHLCSTWQNLI